MMIAARRSPLPLQNKKGKRGIIGERPLALMNKLCELHDNYRIDKGDIL